MDKTKEIERDIEWLHDLTSNIEHTINKMYTRIMRYHKDDIRDDLKPIMDDLESLPFAYGSDFNKAKEWRFNGVSIDDMSRGELVLSIMWICEKYNFANPYLTLK